MTRGAVVVVPLDRRHRSPRPHAQQPQPDAARRPAPQTSPSLLTLFELRQSDVIPVIRPRVIVGLSIAGINAAHRSLLNLHLTFTPIINHNHSTRSRTNEHIIMGSIFSAIGGCLNGIIGAIAGILETIVGVIVMIFVTIFDIILDIICCRCFGSGRRTGRRSGRSSFGRRGGSSAL